MRTDQIAHLWHELRRKPTPFLAFAPDLRRIVYTTNTIEALNRQIRKVIKTRGHFPTKDAARKLIYLAIERAQPKWRHAYNWNAALAAQAPPADPTALTPSSSLAVHGQVDRWPRRRVECSRPRRARETGATSSPGCCISMPIRLGSSRSSDACSSPTRQRATAAGSRPGVPADRGHPASRRHGA
jgi:hypothetical protein